MKGIYVTDTKGINGNGVYVFICSDPKRTDHRFMIFPVLAPCHFILVVAMSVCLSVCVWGWILKLGYTLLGSQRIIEIFEDDGSDT